MKKQLVKDSVWLAVASLFGRSSVVISSILIARWLGKEQFGLVLMAQSTVLMFGGFLGIGFGLAATKFVADERTGVTQERRGGVALLGASNTVLAIIAAVSLLLTRNWLSQSIVDSSELANLLAAGAALLVPTAINFYQIGLLSGLQEFRVAAVANAVSCLITLPAVIFGVWLDGARGAILGHAIGMTVCCWIIHEKIKIACEVHDIDRTFHGIRQHGSMLWHLALPNILLGSINAPIDWTCLAILARHDASAGEVAVFCACNQWCVLLRFLPMTVASALLPAVAQATAAGAGATKELIGFAYLLNGAFAGLLALLFAVASPWILHCYGSEFASSSPVLLLLLGAGVSIAIQLAAERVLAGLNWVWPAFWFNVFRGIVYISMAIVLVTYGALGLALARCVTCLLHAIVAVGASYYVVGQTKTIDARRDKIGPVSAGLLNLRPATRKQVA